MVSHGFKVAEDVPFSPRREMTAEVEGAPIESVELSGLMATQPHVKRSVVRAFVENPALIFRGQRNLFGTLEDQPVIEQHGGRRYIHDGHSRLAAKRLLGETHVLARVIDMGEPVQKTPPWKLEERDGKWLVVGTENGRVYGSHDTREKALAHLRALYVNVPEARKSQEGQQAEPPAPMTQDVESQEEK